MRVDGHVAVLGDHRARRDVLGPDPDHDVLADGAAAARRDRRLEEAGVDDGRIGGTGELRGEEVHGRRADEPGDEQVRRPRVKVLRSVDLLEDAVAHHGDPIAHRHGLDLVVRHVHGRALDALMEPLQLRAGVDA